MSGLHLQLQQLKPNSLWMHTRTKTTYCVLHVGRLEATQELVVVYQHASGSDIWVRPVDSWFAFIDNGPNQRFVPLVDDAGRPVRRALQASSDLSDDDIPF